MEKQGLVRKSASPWASPVVVVGKKGGDSRFCVDYRKLNAVTKSDSYPLPRIDDMLESFSGASWFSTLDLVSGYWQIAMDEADIEKTAFITPFGLYEFKVMPFGLAYAPGTFQRLMNYILHEYLGKFVAVYLDDIIIYSKGTLESHLDHLKQVFETLRRANLMIKLKKCYFCMPNIHFLGHVVGRDGIRPDPEKIEKVKNFPEPKNISQLRSALGLFSYYRKFIKDFSKIAKPLNNLLKKDELYVWTEKQQRAFDYLKQRLMNAPILTYPNFEKSFILYTDASGSGIGAVLMQKGADGKEYVISYASRSLNKAEQNYPITDQECLAVVWAIKHYQHYLELRPFTVITDHSALKWLQTFKIPKGRRARWVMELQQFRFDIKHRPGKANANADALSRMYDGEANVAECYMANLGTMSWDNQESNDEIIYDSDELRERRNPILWDCCGQEICYCINNQDDYWNADDEWENSQYDQSEFQNDWNLAEDEQEKELISLYETVAYTYTETEIQQIFKNFLKTKHVVAGRPIRSGGTRCDFHCDTKNHHLHNYCKACRKNLLLNVVIYDCVIGLGVGKIHFDMNPEFLINKPWWKEPAKVFQENQEHYHQQFRELQDQYDGTLSDVEYRSNFFDNHYANSLRSELQTEFEVLNY